MTTQRVISDTSPKHQCVKNIRLPKPRAADIQKGCDEASNGSVSFSISSAPDIREREKSIGAPPKAAIFMLTLTVFESLLLMGK